MENSSCATNVDNEGPTICGALLEVDGVQIRLGEAREKRLGIEAGRVLGLGVLERIVQRVLRVFAHEEAQRRGGLLAGHAAD